MHVDFNYLGQDVKGKVKIFTLLLIIEADTLISTKHLKEMCLEFTVYMKLILVLNCVFMLSTYMTISKICDELLNVITLVLYETSVYK